MKNVKNTETIKVSNTETNKMSLYNTEGQHYKREAGICHLT